MAPPTNADEELGNHAPPEETITLFAPPEEIITLFAVRLAILEKASSGLACLDFIWATVVLLGGFATSIETIDFWFVTIISLIEGTRIVRQSQELEWQHKTTSNKSKVSLVPCTWGLSKAKNVSRLFLLLQWLSGLVCAVLSLFRLCKQSYGVVDSSTKNRKLALNIFYGLSLADAFLYLLQKVCWKFLKPYLFSKVRSEYHFVDSRDHRVPDFEIYSLFSDTYSRCIKGSVLDGLGMGFVQYIAGLLLSSDDNEQLRGAQIMSAITTKVEDIREQTLSAIGAKQEVVERLIQMLNCRDKKAVEENRKQTVEENRKEALSAIVAKQEVVERLIQMLNCRDQKEIREKAGRVVLNMVEITHNNINKLVTSSGCFIESVGSLLYDSDTIKKDSSGYKVRDYHNFSVLGLQILLRAVEAVEDSTIIKGVIEALLPKIIGIIKLYPNPPSMTTERVHHALELLTKLREKHEPQTMKGMKINSECICNLSGILQHRERFKHGHLILSINMLKALAKTEDGIKIDDDNKAVLGNLFSVFLSEETHNNEETESLVTVAGEALVLLSGNNKYNCQQMMKFELGQDQPTLMATLSSKLDDPLRGIAVARILRNLCVHADDAELPQLSENEARKVLELVTKKRDKHQEAAIGLAAQLLRLKEGDFLDALKDFALKDLATMASLISEILGAVRRNRRLPNEDTITKFSLEFLVQISKIKIAKDYKYEIKSSMSEEVRELLERKLKKQVNAPAHKP